MARTTKFIVHPSDEQLEKYPKEVKQAGLLLIELAPSIQLTVA